MVHTRHNEKEANPNPNIDFITCLPDEPVRQEEARRLLRALAAQVKPVMKRHGFEVNSLEEYEYNAVFAGRNWNGGETIELVLRQPNGSFYPTYWLMSTLCHELAHIKHMNHGAAFQALWSRLRTEVRQLQSRGYYGDGFWSSGTRLRDLARIGGDGVEFHDLPEYVCGGAQTRSRPTANRRRLHGRSRGKRREVVPSLHTGAQTGKKPKAGSRVTSKHAFTGEGITLGKSDDAATGTFRKRAYSKRAREERALAADRRLLLQGKSQAAAEEEGSTTDSDGEVEIIPETDADRRRALQDSEHSSGVGGNPQRLSTKDWETFRDELKPTSSTVSRLTNKTESNSKTTLLSAPVDADVIEIFSSDNEKDGRCDIPQSSGSVFTTGNVYPSGLSRNGKGKETISITSRDQKSPGRGKLVQTEIGFKNKPRGTAVSVNHADRNGEGMVTQNAKPSPSNGLTRLTEKSGKMWSCLVCTLENEGGHLACSACGTPKGQQTWSGVLEN